ncbi:MAG: Stage II sporulation protein Q [Firmicutes bacterium ADurb.Bin193]|nr:MAG: Stage II sporulation protein Q [Firmicutes bacterium ADurb.Bin193]
MKIKTKLIKLFTNRGVYILLILLVGILSVMGYVTNLKNVKTRIADTQSLSVVYEPADEEVELSDTPTALREENEQASAGAVASAAADEPEKVVFMLPLQGELGAEYSGDELVFSQTMQDWRVHKGIDIRGNVGTQVKAAADGVVTNVFGDEMMGATVVIQHVGGIETVYSNLQIEVIAELGQKVKKGDVIGGVGTTAASEIVEPPHLHFEMKKDGIHVNPFDFIS